MVRSEALSLGMSRERPRRAKTVQPRLSACIRSAAKRRLHCFTVKTAKYSDPPSSTSPEDYREINRAAYDALAEEYRARREADREKDLALIRPFVRLLRQQFEETAIRILDLGCGNGLNLSMFADEGFEVTGIDISSRMLNIARDTCPSAALIEGDFLEYPFPPASFEGVFAKAIVHLFPRADASRLITKIYDVLRPHGVFYVTTTVELNPGEGLRSKHDYERSVVRYRRSWSETELSQAVLGAGFEIIETGYNQEPSRGKTWFNIWAIRP